jgi:hypothetical protein
LVNRPVKGKRPWRRVVGSYTPPEIVSVSEIRILVLNLANAILASRLGKRRPSGQFWALG